MNQSGSITITILALFLVIASFGLIWWFNKQSASPQTLETFSGDTVLEERYPAFDQTTGNASDSSNIFDYSKAQQLYNLDAEQLEILSRVDNSRL